jgi:hypothetical protein
MAERKSGCGANYTFIFVQNRVSGIWREQMSRGNNFIPTSLEKNLRILNCPDCVNLTEHFRCSVLRISECPGGNCSFRQGTSERKSSINKWRKRMNGLPPGEQRKIATSYWGGKMPWKEE